MPKPILRARPAPRLAEPRISEPLLSLFAAVSPVYLRFALRFRSVSLLGADRAVEAFRDFQEGRTRLVVAFRHPYGDEPQLVAHAIARSIPRAARRSGRPLPRRTHAHFVHGYEVPLWMGPFVRWLLPRAGAVPVHHVKFDKAGMARIRDLLANGKHPLAIAPEGQVSYTSEAVPRLERGTELLCRWCLADLAKAGRSETVQVLPVSVHYRYGRGGKRALERILRLLENACGLPRRPGASAHQRLRAAAEATVAAAERFYAELDRSEGALPGSAAAAEAPSLNARFGAVVEAALRAGERALRLPSDGDVPRRFYRIRQAGWDRIYRDGLDSLPPLDRALADRETAEAWYAMRHMELADLGSYLDFDSLREDDPIERYMETADNYWDLTSRLRGGNISDRLNIAKKDAVLVFGRPLDAAHPGDAASAEGLTADLERSYLDCVDEYVKEYRHGER